MVGNRRGGPRGPAGFVGCGRGSAGPAGPFSRMPSLLTRMRPRWRYESTVCILKELAPFGSSTQKKKSDYGHSAERARGPAVLASNNAEISPIFLIAFFERADRIYCPSQKQSGPRERQGRGGRASNRGAGREISVLQKNHLDRGRSRQVDARAN